MSDIKPIATLSSKGYVYSIVEKTDRLMAIFIASDANQDYLFSGSISNLSILLQQYGKDMMQLSDRLKTTLENYLGAFYESAIVQISDDSLTSGSARVGMTISITVTENGERYDVANLLTLIDGKFEKITKLNNTGNSNYL